MHLKKFLLIILIFVFTFSCSKNPTSSDNKPDDGYVYVQPPETGDGWQTTSLSDVGMNKNKIVDLINKIQNQVYEEVHAVVIVKDEKLVFEEYFPGHDFGEFPNSSLQIPNLSAHWRDKFQISMIKTNFVSNPPCDEILTRFILPAIRIYSFHFCGTILKIIFIVH